MSLLAFLALAVPTFIVYYVLSYYWWVSKYPKGPRPYPVVGNLRQLTSAKIHLEFRELSLKYGPIFTVFLPTPVVIITSYEGVREAYVTKGESLTDRPVVAADEEFNFGFNSGVINANGQSWMENRRLTITILRDFGMGKSLMEQKVNLSIAEYLRHLDSIEDKNNVDLQWPIQLMISNIINETLFGFRYQYDDCQPLVDFAEAFTVLSDSALSNLIARFSSSTLSFLQKIPQIRELARKVHGANVHRMKSYIEKNTARAMESFDENGDDECFVHAYSRKIGNSPHLTKMQLHAVCLDVFAAGQETGTTTLRWAMLLLAADQQKQGRAREEILRVVGVDRLPSMADKHLLPFTSAIVHEVQRKANNLQVNANRRTSEDVEIMGHLIPAGTTLIGDIFQIMAHDPIFENPEEFRPERYLSDTEKGSPGSNVAFLVGKETVCGRSIDRPKMEGVDKSRNCLICAVPITECHLGIDSCRACAVFYKRIRTTNRPPKNCKGGEGKCIEKDATTSCRKCRYDRFSEVMNNALAVDCDEELEIPQIVCDPVELRRIGEKHVETAFIDHNTFLSDLPSSSDTPLLDKIRWSFSLMCQARKTGETATKPISYHPSQGELDGSKIRFVPVTYSMIIPNARIFAAALFDFAKMTFPGFSKLNDANRGLCIHNTFQQVNLIEASYRSAHYFPDDLDTYFESYTTIVNDETIQSFLDDCPYETNKHEAIEAMKVGMKRTRNMNREFFHRVKPDDDEFLMLLGFSFWNNEVAMVNDELSDEVEKNRKQILEELQRVYKRRGKANYAGRLGELFSLLDNNEENVTLIQHDLELYKLHNMFNEAFPSKNTDSEQSFTSHY